MNFGYVPQAFVMVLFLDVVRNDGHVATEIKFFMRTVKKFCPIKTVWTATMVILQQHGR
jgi:hypothetical protein